MATALCTAETQAALSDQSEAVAVEMAQWYDHEGDNTSRTGKPMSYATIQWTPTATPGEWRATIQDTSDHIWKVTVQRNAAAFGRTDLMTATMICAAAGMLKSTNRLTTLTDVENWCYEELRITGRQNDSPV